MRAVANGTQCFEHVELFEDVPVRPGHALAAFVLPGPERSLDGVDAEDQEVRVSPGPVERDIPQQRLCGFAGAVGQVPAQVTAAELLRMGQAYWVEAGTRSPAGDLDPVDGQPLFQVAASRVVQIAFCLT